MLDKLLDVVVGQSRIATIELWAECLDGDREMMWATIDFKGADEFVAVRFDEAASVGHLLDRQSAPSLENFVVLVERDSRPSESFGVAQDRLFEHSGLSSAFYGPTRLSSTCSTSRDLDYRVF